MVPLNNRFRLAIIDPGKCKYILTLPHYIKSCTHPIISSALANIFFKDFATVFKQFYRGVRWFPLVPLGYSWLSLVILGYPWLSLVILGYPWLSLVILGYPWLSLVILGYPWLYTIPIYVKSFAHLQLFSPSFSEISCSRGQMK